MAEEEPSNESAAEGSTVSAPADEDVSEVVTEETTPTLDATPILDAPATEEAISEEAHVVALEEEKASVPAEEVVTSAQNPAVEVDVVVGEADVELEAVATAIPVVEHTIPEEPATEGEPVPQEVAAIEEPVVAAPAVETAIIDTEDAPAEAEISAEEEDARFAPAVAEVVPVEQQIKPAEAVAEVEAAPVFAGPVDEAVTIAENVPTEELVIQENKLIENVEANGEAASIPEMVPVAEEMTTQEPSSDKAVVAATVTGVATLAVAEGAEEESHIDVVSAPSAEIIEATPSAENEIEAPHQVDAVVEDEVKPSVVEAGSEDNSPRAPEQAEAPEQQSAPVEDLNEETVAPPVEEAPAVEKVDEDVPRVEEAAEEDATEVEPAVGITPSKKEEDIEAPITAAVVQTEVEGDNQNIDDDKETTAETVPDVEESEVLEENVDPPVGDAAAAVADETASLEEAVTETPVADADIAVDAIEPAAHYNKSTTEDADQPAITSQLKSDVEEASVEEATVEDVSPSDSREVKEIEAPLSEAIAQIPATPHIETVPVVEVPQQELGVKEDFTSLVAEEAAADEVPAKDEVVPVDTAAEESAEKEKESMPHLEGSVIIPATENVDEVAPLDEAASPTLPNVEVIAPVEEENTTVSQAEGLAEVPATLTADEDAEVLDEGALAADVPFLAGDEQSPARPAAGFTAEVISGEDIADDNAIAATELSHEEEAIVEPLPISSVETSANALDKNSSAETGPISEIEDQPVSRLALDSVISMN